MPSLLCAHRKRKAGFKSTLDQALLASPDLCSCQALSRHPRFLSLRETLAVFLQSALAEERSPDFLVALPCHPGFWVYERWSCFRFCFAYCYCHKREISIRIQTKWGTETPHVALAFSHIVTAVILSNAPNFEATVSLK